jgi:hypothetical protein
VNDRSPELLREIGKAYFKANGVFKQQLSYIWEEMTNIMIVSV